MGLKIEFIIPKYATPSVALAHDIHLAISDGCYADTEKYFSRLTEAQQFGLKRDRSAKESPYLLYMNTVMAEDFCFRDGRLDLHCPQCGTDYAVTYDEYRSALDKFRGSDGQQPESKLTR